MSRSPAQDPSRSDQAKSGEAMRGFRTSGLLVLASRILGLLRDMGTAALFGLSQSPTLEAFVFAFRVPDLFRRFFGEGTLTATLIPAMTDRWDRDRDSAWVLLSKVLLTLSLGGAALILALELSLSLGWGVSEVSEGALTKYLTMLLLPYVLLITMTGILSSSLLAVGCYGFAGLPPIVLNVVWLAALATIVPWGIEDPESRVRHLASFILGAGLLQVLSQWWPLRRLGFRLRPLLPTWREAWEQGGKATLLVVTLSVTHINTFLDSGIAWFHTGQGDSPIEPGAISAIYFGERLYMFPLGVVGIAAVSGFYPTMSRLMARQNFPAARMQLARGLEMIGLLAFPATVGLVMVALPLTRLLFERGAFDMMDSQRASCIVVGYSVGLAAFSMLPLVTRTLVLTGQIRFLSVVAVVIIAANALLNTLLAARLAEWSLAGSTSLLAIIELVWLLCGIRTADRQMLPLQQILRAWSRAIVCAVIMGAGCYAMQMLVRELAPAIQVLALVATGVAVYAAASLLLQRDGLRRLLVKSQHEAGQ